MRIYNDENGKAIDYLAVRNEEIKEKLDHILEDFLLENSNMLKLKKPVNLGYRFTKQLYSVLASYPKMNADDFVALDYDDINDYWLKYLDLTAYYNRHFEIVDNKQIFMAFLGINSRQYSDLEKHNDDDIKGLMNSINGAFVGLGFVATESGGADSKATKMRLEAKDVGHNVVSAKEDKLIQAITPKSPLELQKEMQAILGGEVKRLK